MLAKLTESGYSAPKRVERVLQDRFSPAVCAWLSINVLKETATLVKPTSSKTPFRL